MAPVSQGLAGLGQVQRLHPGAFSVRHRLAHQGDEVGFHPGGLVQTAGRGIFDSQMDEHRHRRVIAGDAECLQIGQRPGNAPPHQPAGPRQIIGRHTFIRGRVHHVAHQIQQLRPPSAGDLRAVQDRGRLVHRADAQRGREHLHAVLLAAQQRRLFQPGDGGLHAGIVGVAVAFELLILFLTDNLARRGDHLAGLLPVQPPQRLEDRADLVARQPRPGRQRELPLHIVGREQQHATGGVAIPARAPRLLQVILQRPRNVAVHDQPDIGLVDAHAKRIGRGDHPQLPGAEGLLHVALALGRQACMEVVRCQPLPFQELRHLFRRPPRGAVDHGARGPLGRQVRVDRCQDVGKLGRLLRRQHGKGQVRPHRSAIQQHHRGPQAGLEMVADVAHHLGLGGGGQAQQRGHGVAREFLDEAADVAVVGPEIVAPFRHAMGLVQHPEPDLALLQDRADRG